MEGDEKEHTLPLFHGRKRAVYRLKSHARDELQSFRTSLRWLGLDQSSDSSTASSWIVFIVFVILLPLLILVFLSCDSCDVDHVRPYNNVVQISESVVAAIAFVSLNSFVKKYGLRRFLFLDQLCGDSARVARTYTSELNSAFRLLACFLIPCLLLELALKIWWYATAPSQMLLLQQKIVSHTIMCVAETLSRVYRAAIFFLVCVLFRLACSLQILRFQDFIKSFNCFDPGSSSQPISILRDHLRISSQLRVISHRFRVFIVAELICITFSQFVNLFVSTAPRSHMNLFTALDLALSSVVLVTGAVIFLHSAARITHKAQGVKAVASRWHALATCNTYDSDSDDERAAAAAAAATSSSSFANQSVTPAFEAAEAKTPFSHGNTAGQTKPESEPEAENEWEHKDPLGDSDSDGESSAEDPLSFFNFAEMCQSQIASFQKRLAVVNYLEHNTTGITVFGLKLDRTSLHMIFGIELSVTLFILGKTISISA